MADTRFIDAGGQALSADERNQLRYRIYRDSPFMRDARRLLRALQRVRDLAEEFADRDTNNIAYRLLTAGFDPLDRESELLLDIGNDMVADAVGFLWALRAFTRFLESEVPKASRKGASHV